MANNFVLFIYFDIIIIFCVNNKFQALADDEDISTCAFIRSQKLVNCSYRKLAYVPKLTGGDIAVIDFSSATMGKDEPFNALTFATYPKLINLIMRSAIIFTDCSFLKNESCPPKVFPGAAFVPLKFLESVDFSYSNVVFNVTMRWPSTMTMIHLDFLKLNAVPSMENLEELEDFSCNNGSLRRFPVFNKQAPINRIELSNNPLDDVNVTDIAHFCELKYLGINIPKGGNFSKKEKYCPCIRLQKWVKRMSISGAELLVCDNDGGNLTEKSCKEDMTFKEEDKLYNQCSSKSSGASFWELLVMALVFALLFPLLYFANETYNAHFGRKKGVATVRGKGREESDDNGSASDDRGDDFSFGSEEEE